MIVLTRFASLTLSELLKAIKLSFFFEYSMPVVVYYSCAQRTVGDSLCAISFSSRV